MYGHGKEVLFIILYFAENIIILNGPRFIRPESATSTTRRHSLTRELVRTPKCVKVFDSIERVILFSAFLVKLNVFWVVEWGNRSIRTAI